VYWLIAGLLVPIVFHLVPYLSHFPYLLVSFWPTSLLIIAFEDNPSAFPMVTFIAAGLNAIVYCAIGTLIWFFTDHS